MRSGQPIDAGRRAFIAALVAAPASTLATPAEPAPGFTDLMPDFWRAYDAVATLPAAERAARLARDFFAPREALYRRAGRKSPPGVDEIGRWLPKFDPVAAEARAVHARFADRFRANTARFRAALPDFDAAASPVFLLPSLFGFDAHLEPDGRSLPLFFAPDGIVRYHGAGADLDVLFSHEIFHCYQGQRNPALALDPAAPVWASLWMEGSATWASERLNPGAPLRHVLLDDDALLRDGPTMAPRVAGALLDEYEATDEATQVAFFSAGATGIDWPPRAGYYVGWLACGRIATGGVSLAEMAGMAPARLRDRFAAALREIRDLKA